MKTQGFEGMVSWRFNDCQTRCWLQARLAQGIVRDAHLRHAHRMPQASANSFGQRLFGGKAFHQQTAGMWMFRKLGHLADAQDAPGEAFAVALKH